MYTAARLLLSKVVNKTEKEICKEICKQGCENWDQCKEFVQNTKIYENMVNRLHSLEGRMYNGYQKFKNTPVGCAVNNSLCRVISEVDDVIQLVNKRNTVEQMSTPQVRVLPIHPAIQQYTERLLTKMPTPQYRMLATHPAIQQYAERLLTKMPTPQYRMLATLPAIQQDIERFSTEMPMPQVMVSSLRQEIQQAIERFSTEMPMPQNINLLTLGQCSTSNHTLSTSSSEQSSTINVASTDTLSAFSPKKLQNKRQEVKAKE